MRLLARRGHTVLTGGYMGTMEAVSRGAAEAGGHVIGVTCEEIGRWHGRTANTWVSEEWKQTTLIQRLEVLIRSADAAMALPGGPGTLAEIALMWNLMIVGSLPAEAADPRRSRLGIGSWTHSTQNLGEYSPAAQRRLLRFASTPAAAVETAGRDGFVGSGVQGPSHACPMPCQSRFRQGDIWLKTNSPPAKRTSPSGTTNSF